MGSYFRYLTKNYSGFLHSTTQVWMDGWNAASLQEVSKYYLHGLELSEEFSIK